jgi:hypothetical protein
MPLFRRNSSKDRKAAESPRRNDESGINTSVFQRLSQRRSDLSDTDDRQVGALHSVMLRMRFEVDYHVRAAVKTANHLIRDIRSQEVSLSQEQLVAASLGGHSFYLTILPHNIFQVIWTDRSSEQPPRSRSRSNDHQHTSASSQHAPSETTSSSELHPEHIDGGLTKDDVQHLFSGAPHFMLEKGRRGRYFPQAHFPWDNQLQINDLQDRVYIKHEAFALSTLHAHLPVPDEVAWRPVGVNYPFDLPTRFHTWESRLPRPICSILFAIQLELCSFGALRIQHS